MKRQDIENLSRKLLSEYGEMLKEMYTDTVCDGLTLSSGLAEYYYVNVRGLSFNFKDSESTIYDYMTRLFVGAHSLSCPVSVVIVNKDDSFNVYWGTVIDRLEALIGLLKGVLSRIDFKETGASGNYAVIPYKKLTDMTEFCYGGYIKGNPSRPSDKNESSLYSVINGMSGKDWCLSIFALPQRKESSAVRHSMWMTKQSECSDLQKVNFSEHYADESISYEKSYQQSKQYAVIMEKFIERLNDSLICGEWDVSVNYCSNDESDADLLGALLVSAFHGEESSPEPIHRIRFDNNNVVFPEQHIMHNSYSIQLPYPKYSNYISSSELGVYAAFPVKEVFGLSVSDYTDFDVDRDDTGNLNLGRIISFDKETSNSYSIDINELNRHCLVAGLTGSGKTNTLKSIVYSASQTLKMPFIIIEPAKKEYWELYKLGLSDLQIYSVGSNEKGSHKLCINPFERARFVDEHGVEHKVPIQTHIDFVFAAFKASFIMYTPMPYVLEKAIYEIYEDAGWNIQADTNANGDVYPTMEDLFFKIEDVVNDNGYDTKMKQDLIGSLQARINSMRLGTKGETLNVASTFPLENILNGKVIIELEDIGDDDVKAFIISMILILLLEYRRQQTDSQLELRHLMVIEEAHRLLKNVQSGTGESADPRGAAVEFFCNLLAELRSKGQGFIVADQIPSKLAPDLVKNTNLKIVHRTVAEEERVLLGRAMHMTDEQIDYLASLRQGVAAVYSEGDCRPVLVKSPNTHNYLDDRCSDYSRENVLECSYQNISRCLGNEDYSVLTDRQNKICRMCNRKCPRKYTDLINQLGVESFERFADSINPYQTKKCKASEIDKSIIDYLSSSLGSSYADDVHNRICLLNNLIDAWNLESELSKILTDYYSNKIRRLR